ncbi:MAG: hypothetical protein KC547_20070, partial [Anaerolineae bacterium]|nr:hypothetical protein [Anaerolineae bacterium]
MSRWVNNIVALLFCISLTMCPGSNVTHSECQNAIVYTAIEDGRSDIFLNDMCNGMYRQITYNAASWMPVFSPRGDEIVYERTFGVT